MACRKNGKRSSTIRTCKTYGYRLLEESAERIERIRNQRGGISTGWT